MADREWSVMWNMSDGQSKVAPGKSGLKSSGQSMRKSQVRKSSIRIVGDPWALTRGPNGFRMERLGIVEADARRWG